MTKPSEIVEPFTINRHFKLLLIVISVVFVFACSIYDHLYLGYAKVYPHFFYIPIVLSGFWYGRKTVWVAAFLSTILILPHMLANGLVGLEDDVLRALMYMVIGGLTGIVGDYMIRFRENLREARDYLENVFDNANAPIVVWDSQMKITKFNKAAERLINCKADDVMGKSIISIISPESRSMAEAYIKFTTLIDQSEAIEIPVSQAFGEKRVVLWNFAPLYGPDGIKVVATIAQGQDITDRKSAEESLRESEHRYRSLVERSPDLIVLHVDGKIVYVNNAGRRIVGAESDEDTIGRDIWDFIDPDYRANALERVNELLSSEKEMPMTESRFLRLDGSSFDVEVISTSFTYQGKKAIQTVARDISERKRFISEIYESEERYRALIEGSPDAIILHKNGDLIFANETAAKMLGFDNTQQFIAIGNISGVVHKDDLPRMKQNMREVISSDSIGPIIEVRLLRNDGSIVYMETRSVALDLKGERVIQTFGHDISKRKVTEEALANAQKQLLISEKMASIGAVSCGISHELSNPLMGIGGYLFELRKRATDKESRLIADRAIEETKRCTSTIRDLLLLGKPTKDGNRWLSCRELLDNISAIKDSVIKDNSIDVRIDMIGDPPDVFSNETYINIVADNLIKNAVDALNESDNKHIEITIDNVDDVPVLRVTDSGIGISKEDLERILDPFYTTKGPNQGSGLGLTICQNIIKSWGGELRIDSKYGQGTTVSVSLPARKKQAIAIEGA